jgi:hypothetical protein
MGFWSDLFGKKKLELLDMDIDTEVAPAVTPTPVKPALTIAQLEEQVEELLRDLFPSTLPEVATAEDVLAEKKRKRSDAAKKAAVTRAANKAKK